MITNEEVRKAVETLKEYVDQQLDCCNCIFSNNMLESDFATDILKRVYVIGD